MPIEECFATLQAPRSGWSPNVEVKAASTTRSAGLDKISPVGEIACPMTVVARSRLPDKPAPYGVKPSSPNAAVLSGAVVPRSDPVSSALYRAAAPERSVRAGAPGW